MRRHVRVARFGEVAVGGASQEAGVPRRIEPAAHLRSRGDLDGLLRLLLLLLLLVIASRSAAASTPMPPPVAPILEASTPTPTATATALLTAVAPVMAVEPLILLLLRLPVVTAAAAPLPARRDRAIHSLRRRLELVRPTPSFAFVGVSCHELRSIARRRWSWRRRRC